MTITATTRRSEGVKLCVAALVLSRVNYYQASKVVNSMGVSIDKSTVHRVVHCMQS